MVSKQDLAGLREYDEQGGRVLSVYLDVEQSNAANLNQGFVHFLNEELRGMTRQLEEETERQELETCRQEVQGFVSRYIPEAKGLVLFSKANGSLWVRELDVPTRTEVRWSDTAYIQPLLEALDEYQRYGVVLVDRSKARIFKVDMGKIEKCGDVLSAGSVRHNKSAGTDRLFSQPGFQRRADEHVHLHMKHVAEVVEELMESTPLERLLLAGTPEATSELRRIIPKWLRARVSGSLVLAMTATEEEVLAGAEAVEHRVERSFELERVEKLFEESGRKKATTGVSDTLRAINEKRVRELMFAGGHILPGGRCPKCGSVCSSVDVMCAYCNIAAEPVDNIVEAAAHRALAAGASVEQCQGAAAERLSLAGGMGAFLRY